MSHVVVGIDGSKGGQDALAFAINEARLRGATLHVVHVQAFAPPPRDAVAHSPQSEYVSAEAFGALVGREREGLDELEERARQQGERLLDRVLGEVDLSGIEVERTVVFDRRPARRLIELVNTHDDEVSLLVVGSRGRGELTGLLLGSVSQACVAHARVPVTVVPPARR